MTNVQARNPLDFQSVDDWFRAIKMERYIPIFQRNGINSTHAADEDGDLASRTPPQIDTEHLRTHMQSWTDSHPLGFDHCQKFNVLHVQVLSVSVAVCTKCEEQVLIHHVKVQQL